MPSCPRDFAQYVQPNKILEQGIGSRLANTYALFQIYGHDHRLAVEQVERGFGIGRALAQGKNARFDMGAQCQNLSEYIPPFGGGFSHALQEKPHPVDEVVRCPHLHQGIVITGAVAFEKVG